MTQSFFKSTVVADVYGLQCEGDCNWAICQNAAEEPLRSFDQFGWFHDVIHQAKPRSVIRIDRVTGKNHLERSRSTDEPGETLCPAVARNDAKLQFRKSEFRVSGRNP